MNGCIEVTNANLRLLVQTAYDLSKPQGMGYLHYQPGSLSDEDADMLLECKGTSVGTPSYNVVVSMDYVRGRAVKMSVFKVEDYPNKLFIRDTWFDHTEEEFHILLAILGVET